MFSLTVLHLVLPADGMGVRETPFLHLFHESDEEEEESVCVILGPNSTAAAVLSPAKSSFKDWMSRLKGRDSPFLSLESRLLFSFPLIIDSHIHHP